jgi:hypothetical protein
LVTDLPADFEVFGQAVATSMADLLGGTSGQVLAKNSNTDMDFVWVAQDDSNAIQNTIVDAKGDLIGATAADTPARLGVGTNGQVLTADSTAATGLAWATPTSGSMTVIASGSLPTGSGTLSLTSISGAYTHLQFHCIAWNGSGNNTIIARLNGDTGANYGYTTEGYTLSTIRTQGLVGQTSFAVTIDSAVSGNNKNITVMNFPFYTNATTGKVMDSSTGFLDSTSVRALAHVNGYYYGANAAVTQLDFIYGSNWAGGTYVLYGVK